LDVPVGKSEKTANLEEFRHSATVVMALLK